MVVMVEVVEVEVGVGLAFGRELEMWRGQREMSFWGFGEKG